MQADFDVFAFPELLRQRWRVSAVTCLAAMVLSLGVSLALPRRYTASASVVIEPPGGVDSRAATAVSPVYLESLKTYERFAEGDSLFAQAVEQFHLDRSQPIENLKQHVLKVTKLRDTKILVIEVTLPDPKLAHGVAEYLARQTADLSRSESLAADRDMVEESQRQATDACFALERAEQLWDRDAQLESVDSLQAELDGLHELQFDVRRQLSEAQTDAADYQARARIESNEESREQSTVATARASALEMQSTNLNRDITQKNAAISARRAQREKAQSDLEMRRAEYESTANHLRDVRASAGSRGERLSVIDPGIVPQRPSSPNVWLNVLAAGFLAMLICIAYFSVQFAYRSQAGEFAASLPRSRRAG